MSSGFHGDTHPDSAKESEVNDQYDKCDHPSQSRNGSCAQKSNTARAHRDKERDKGQARGNWVKNQSFRDIIQHSRVVVCACRGRNDSGDIVPYFLG
jgi:hypothetical protein